MAVNYFDHPISKNAASATMAWKYLHHILMYSGSGDHRIHLPNISVDFNMYHPVVVNSTLDYKRICDHIYELVAEDSESVFCINFTNHIPTIKNNLASKKPYSFCAGNTLVHMKLDAKQYLNLHVACIDSTLEYDVPWYFLLLSFITYVLVSFYNKDVNEIDGMIMPGRLYANFMGLSVGCRTQDISPGLGPQVPSAILFKPGGLDQLYKDFKHCASGGKNWIVST